MVISTNEFWFRPARVKDYEEVIALREVHEGWDPLPYCYHKMLADPQILGIVGESNDGIVSMTSHKKFYCRDELLEKRGAGMFEGSSRVVSFLSGGVGVMLGVDGRFVVIASRNGEGRGGVCLVSVFNLTPDSGLCRYIRIYVRSVNIDLCFVLPMGILLGSVRMLSSTCDSEIWPVAYLVDIYTVVSYA